LVAGLAALVVVAASLSPAAGVTPATPGTPGKAVRAPASAAAPLRLTEHQVSATTLQTMKDTYADSSVHTIVNSVNHHLHPDSSSDCAQESTAEPLDPAVSGDDAFCWDEGDATTQYWSPQGMTSSGDADADGVWGTDRVLVSGWGSANQQDHFGRMALINDTDGSADKYGYRWVLPVIPTDGGNDFGIFGSHMGGMVWWGDKLLVTGSLDGDAHHNAIYVFSTKYIYQANTDADWVGHRGDQVSAHGYQYFWPAIGSYSVPASCDSKDRSADRQPCFDALSMDRSVSPFTLVANEWVSTGATGTASRIWRYALNSADAAMPITTDSSGHADPIDIYDTDIVGIQGTLDRTENGEKVIYTADSVGSPATHGIPWRIPLPAAGEQTAAHATTSTGGSATAQHEWAQHSEGMTFMADQDRLWSQTEWAADVNGNWPTTNPIRQRLVFSLPMTALRSSLT
jgi:hypothetical protein